MFGTIIVTFLLILTVSIIIASMIKDRRRGRHPSCGGNCGSCSLKCSSLYPHLDSLIEEQKTINKNTEKAE